MVNVTGKTELAKQVARYMHKDVKKVSDRALHAVHTHDFFVLHKMQQRALLF